MLLSPASDTGQRRLKSVVAPPLFVVASVTVDAPVPARKAVRSNVRAIRERGRSPVGDCCGWPRLNPSGLCRHGAEHGCDERHSISSGGRRPARSSALREIRRNFGDISLFFVPTHRAVCGGVGTRGRPSPRPVTVGTRSSVPVRFAGRRAPGSVWSRTAGFSAWRCTGCRIVRSCLYGGASGCAGGWPASGR